LDTGSWDLGNMPTDTRGTIVQTGVFEKGKGDGRAIVFKENFVVFRNSIANGPNTHAKAFKD